MSDSNLRYFETNNSQPIIYYTFTEELQDTINALMKTHNNYTYEILLDNLWVRVGISTYINKEFSNQYDKYTHYSQLYSQLIDEIIHIPNEFALIVKESVKVFSVLSKYYLTNITNLLKEVNDGKEISTSNS